MTLTFGFIVKGGFYPNLESLGDNPEAVYAYISEVTDNDLENTISLYSNPGENGEQIILHKAVV